MATLFDGVLHVHHGFWWIADVTDPGDLTAAFAGQTNGLLGGRHWGALWGRTGLHTGPVHLRVEAVDASPGLVDGWEEVVEASFRPPQTATLAAFEEFHELPELPAATWLRARLHGRAMDEADGADSLSHDAAPVDHYLLQVWPEDDARDDEILVETSRCARHWHTTAGPVD